MLSHDWLDSLSGFICMVEVDSRYKMVYNMSFDDAMEKKAAYEAEFPIDSCGGATGKSPSLSSVMRNGRIGMLEEGNYYLIESVELWILTLVLGNTYCGRVKSTCLGTGR